VSRLETGATDEDVKGPLMSEEDNTAVLGRWFTEFWGADFNPGVIDGLAAPDIRQDGTHELQRSGVYRT